MAAVKKKMVPPDGGWGWMIVLGVSLVNFSTRPIEPSFGLLFGDLLSDLSIATTGAGIIVSTYEALINFSGLFVGPLIKVFSFRKVAFFGSVLTGLGLIATYPAASMAHILSTYSILNGLGIGFSSSATFVALNHYFKQKRGQAVGITMTGTGLGLLLMPQAVRYLTEEYDFTGSILILGALAFNACVGSALLHPVQWHLKEVPEEEEKIILRSVEDKSAYTSNKKLSTCPQITITNTIAENDEDEEGDEEVSTPPPSFENPMDTKEEPVPTRRMSERPRFFLKLDRKYSLIDKDSKPEYQLCDLQNSTSLNKSSTEPKFEKYFEESRRKLSECPNSRMKNTSTCSINNKQEFGGTTPGPGAIRKRKGSTISNLSILDFTGSSLHLHAIEHELQDQETEHGSNNNRVTTPEKVGKHKTEDTLWQRFSEFMDLDLLKDPVYLNILFGLSIFYVAEFNFKMVVPFFLADLGHSKSETAFCLSMMAASDIVARVILPPICDRICNKISRRTMFMVAAIFCATSRSALAETGEWIQLETILIISGFFRGATLINFMLVISEYCDSKIEKLPAAFGLHMVAKGIFIVAIGPLIGLIRDLTGSYPTCIHSQTVLMIMCTLAWSIEYGIVYLKQRPKNQSLNNIT